MVSIVWKQVTGGITQSMNSRRQGVEPSRMDPLLWLSICIPCAPQAQETGWGGVTKTGARGNVCWTNILACFSCPTTHEVQSQWIIMAESVCPFSQLTPISCCTSLECAKAQKGLGIGSSESKGGGCEKRYPDTLTCMKHLLNAKYFVHIV